MSFCVRVMSVAQGEDGDEQGPGRPLGSTRGAAMRPFVAPGASDGQPLLLLEGLGSVVVPQPPLPPALRLLSPPIVPPA